MKMRKTLLYILGFAALASCSEDVVETSSESFLNGSEKTPISIAANISTDKSAKTRAADASFAVNDELLAYLRHVTATKTGEGDAATYSDITQVSGEGIGPRLAKFTVSALNTDVSYATNYSLADKSDMTMATGEKKLFWDDFNNSNAATTDLRTDGHYLQVYYGYCYNGGTPTTALTEAAGTLGWTVQQDQSTTANFTHSDLLYAKEQKPVKYEHTPAARTDLLIPYTHAMSKVTVELDLQEGFENVATNFANTTVILKGMNTVCDVNAPNAIVTSVPGTDNANVKDITTLPIANTNLNKSFSALIAPTVMTNGKLLAEINNVDGNNYKLELTTAILNTDANNDWNSQLGTDGVTKPGVNYLITVTIRKQEIHVSATIQDWTTVSATGVGEINFTNDITDKTGSIAEALQTGGFDIYQKGTASDATYGKVTTYSYGGDPAKWTRNNDIYWPNGTDKFYFRALSPKGSTTSLTNGSEVIWGTTAAYTWGTEDVAKGGLVAPRTGDVPLEFEHVMSRITFHLIDGLAESTNNADHLDLGKATIQLTNLATGGTLDLQSGNITPLAASPKTFTEDEIGSPKRMGFYAAKENTTETTYDAALTIKEYPVIPQTITDNSRIIITLADGTRYSTALNQCKIKETTTLVGSWERGKDYTYEITIGKEEILFRALVKDWDKKEASGNATLEWD